MPITPVTHNWLSLDGMNVFYREAGSQNAPVVLLPHGYPCSSYEFRNLMAALGHRWRLIAPDFPGCGYSDTPEGFHYHFDGYADFLERFVSALGLQRFVVYMHDFGNWIALRMAMKAPERIAGLIIQNGDIYEDTLGPQYAPLIEYWNNPTQEGYAKIAASIHKEEFQKEFLNDVGPELAKRIPPDMWELHWSLMTPQRRRIAADVIAGLRENREWFPRYQAFLREHQFPTLIVWGPNDGYMPAPSAKAYLRDLPDAELHLLDGGHWLLETHLAEAVGLSEDFLGRVHRR